MSGKNCATSKCTFFNFFLGRKKNRTFKQIEKTTIWPRQREDWKGSLDF
jgi:hypothetical protein